MKCFFLFSMFVCGPHQLCNIPPLAQDPYVTLSQKSSRQTINWRHKEMSPKVKRVHQGGMEISNRRQEGPARRPKNGAEAIFSIIDLNLCTPKP